MWGCLYDRGARHVGRDPAQSLRAEPVEADDRNGVDESTRTVTLPRPDTAVLFRLDAVPPTTG